MIVSPDALRKETIQLIKEIDFELSNVKTTDANIRLLQAKATAYNTLVLLQTKK